MSRTLEYRQQVADFRVRINRIIGAGAPGSRRIHIDTTGSRTWRVPFSTVEEQLVLYGEGRHHSVARVLALFEIARETEALHARARPVSVQTSGAVWQAYKGTTGYNACHTCPCLLLLDGQLPTQITRNRGLQRHIVVEFSDCMLLPRSINEVDIVVDEAAGRQAFAAAAALVLNQRGAGWRQGLERFRDEMRSVLGPIGERLLLPGGHQFRASEPGDQEFLDALGAYYEGLYLRDVDDIQMRNFIGQVRAEMGVP